MKRNLGWNKPRLIEMKESVHFTYLSSYFICLLNKERTKDKVNLFTGVVSFLFLFSPIWSLIICNLWSKNEPSERRNEAHNSNRFQLKQRQKKNPKNKMCGVSSLTFIRFMLLLGLSCVLCSFSLFGSVTMKQSGSVNRTKEEEEENKVNPTCFGWTKALYSV